MPWPVVVRGLVGQAVPAVCSLVANSLGKVAGEGKNGVLNQMAVLQTLHSETLSF